MTAPLLLHAFSTFAVGGPQVRFATIANHFGRAFRHAVVAMDGNVAARERLDPGLDVTFPALPLRKGDTAGNVRVLRRALRAMRPAALLTSNWGTIEWAMANRLQVVRHVHVEDGFGPEERSAQIGRRVWTRRVFLAGRTVVVPSETLRRIALDVWRLNPARVDYVPNGVDLARFSPGRRDGTGCVIGTVAALRAEKNLGRLLRAFAAVGEEGARLVVAGAGPELGPLRATAEGLGIGARLEWAGHVADPAPLLAGFDAFALSSDTEQMPLSLLEAMAAGLAVASTDVGDVRAMLPAEQGELVVGLDDAALAGALRRLIRDAPLRRALGAANRARVEERFDERTMFEAWGRLWAGPAAGG